MHHPHKQSNTLKWDGEREMDRQTRQIPIWRNPYAGDTIVLKTTVIAESHTQKYCVTDLNFKYNEIIN